MKMSADWKWYAALAVFALFTALVVWLPDPRAKPALAPPTPTVNPAGRSSVRSDPTFEDSLEYRVQDGDTVASVAYLFAISEEDLRWSNHLPEDDEFVAGTLIWIPAQ